MKIGLIDVDGHNYPNLALMKISAYHKAKGDSVEWWWGFETYDRVYMSKVFDDTYSPDIPAPFNADQIVRGGTGYCMSSQLPYEIEHMCPDYSLYPELTKDTAYGFLTRGCPNACPFCIVSEKEGRMSRKVADLSEWWSGQKNIVLMDANILACREHISLLEQLADSGACVDFNQGAGRKTFDAGQHSDSPAYQAQGNSLRVGFDEKFQTDCSGPEPLESVRKEGQARRMGFGLCAYQLQHHHGGKPVQNLQAAGYGVFPVCDGLR